MATVTIENLPDDLMGKIQKLAAQQNQTFNEQIISLLKQALQKPQTPLKIFQSPEKAPTREEKCQAVPQVLGEIEQRRKQRRTDVEWLDSTALIREDRER